MAGFDALIESGSPKRSAPARSTTCPARASRSALDDDRLVPEDVRMAYRILKNAGFVPAEIEERKEAAGLRQAHRGDRRGHAGAAARARRLALLEARLEARGTRLPRGSRVRRPAGGPARPGRLGTSSPGSAGCP